MAFPAGNGLRRALVSSLRPCSAPMRLRIRPVTNSSPRLLTAIKQIYFVICSLNQSCPRNWQMAGKPQRNDMKRNFYLLLPFLLVVLLLVACGGAGTANNEPAGDTNQVGNSAGEEVVNDNSEEPAGEAVVPTGYKEYENPTNGLSLAYPNDWSILE